MKREHPGSGMRTRRKARISIHAGIEKALYRAAIDPGFRRDLLDDRLAAIRSRGIGLTAAEATILASVPGERLKLMIDRIRPEKHGKRRFMKAVATAVMTLASGTAVVSCTPEDVPADTWETVGGIFPELPTEDLDAWESEFEAEDFFDADEIPADVPDVEADVEDAAPEADVGDTGEGAEDAPGEEEEAD